MASVPAMADAFKVNESVVPGSTNGNPNLTADEITFNYTARINQTSPIVGGTGAFTESGFFLKNQFLLNNVPVAFPNYSFLNLSEAGLPGGPGGNVLVGQGYRLYGIFNISGTASTNGSGDIVANFQTMTLSLYVDPKQDDTFGFGPPTGGTPVQNLGATATDPSADDQLLLTETLVEGRANIRGGALNNGDYKAILNVTPTPLGSNFFFSPSPFFAFETFAGNTGTLNPPGSLTAPFTSTATGDGSESFQTTATPEPASLAVLGSGLLGIGFLGRRRRSK